MFTDQCRPKSNRFGDDLLLGDIDQILALWWSKNTLKWVKMVFSDHYLNKYPRDPIQLGVYTYWVSVQN